VDASGDKFSRPPLLHGVEQYRDQHLNNRVLTPRADLSLGSSPVPMRERVDNPYVSLLGLAFSYLCQPLFLDESMFLRRDSGTLIAPHGGHLT
jgi:hypothetical protein